MKSLYLSNILLSMVVAALCGCTSSDDDLTTEFGQWQVGGIASKMGGISETIDVDGASTRSIFFGGSNGSRFFQVWDDLDEPMVYSKEGSFLGTFVPAEKGVTTTTLSGSLTGSFKVGDELKLYAPVPVCNFMGQDGGIASMSSKYSFMTATAKVASVSGSTITTSAMTFSSFAVYNTYYFTDENGRQLHVKKLTITAENGTLAKTMNLLDGTNETTNEYVIITQKEASSDDYPTAIRVVIYDLGTVKNTFTYTVLASDGKTYQQKNALSYLFNSGGMHAVVRRQLECIDVEAGVSTGITPPTDEDVQIDDVIKE